MLGFDGDPTLLGGVIKIVSFYLGVGVSLRSSLGGNSAGVGQRHRFISKATCGGDGKDNINSAPHFEL